MIRWRFIHIPKTAGISISQAYGYGTEIGHPHTPASEFDPDVRMFAVIRNPIDRAISICAYLFAVKQRELTPVDFHQWVAAGCHHDHLEQDLAIVSWRGPRELRITSEQKCWLTPAVQLVGYERLAADLPSVIRLLGLTPKKLPLLNVSLRHRTAAAYHDPATWESLATRYYADFQIWNQLMNGGPIPWS